jgi:REP element-mobilizing transposase RayT
MPRRPRLHVPDGVYHAVLRGNHRQPIFFAPADYHRFEHFLAEALVQYACRLHAYCWMSNHVHLAIQVGDRPLGALMRVVASRYARATQRAIPTTGHLFERRYRAILVERDDYLRELTRYIHLNPVRAGIARTASEFHWSSHAIYLGAAAPPWLTTGLIWQLFGENRERAIGSYRHFMAVAPDDAELDRLRRGWRGDPRPDGNV